ncbi:unnamed protein product [Boreogadus saida]
MGAERPPAPAYICELWTSLRPADVIEAHAIVFSGSLNMASGNGNPDSSESLKRDILERLHHRLVHILERQPLDIEGLQFACRQEFVLLSALGVYYNILHSLEDQHRLDISSILHIFQPDTKSVVACGPVPESCC